MPRLFKKYFLLQFSRKLLKLECEFQGVKQNSVVEVNVQFVYFIWIQLLLGNVSNHHKIHLFVLDRMELETSIFKPQQFLLSFLMVWSSTHLSFIIFLFILMEFRMLPPLVECQLVLVFKSINGTPQARGFNHYGLFCQ